MKHTSRLSTSTTLVLGALFLTPSCVTQPEHDDAVSMATFYQRRTHDLEETVTRLETELEDCRGQQLSFSTETVESSYDTTDYELRISELQRQLDSLGRPINDVERFDIEGVGSLYLVRDRLLFPSGSMDILAEGRKALLDEVAKSIRSEAYDQIVVRGHTDNDPVRRPETLKKFPYGNMQLSAMRAIVVADLLTKDGGLSADRVVIEGHGSHDPLVPNDSAENKQLNRRVEILVKKP